MNELECVVISSDDFYTVPGHTCILGGGKDGQVHLVRGSGWCLGREYQYDRAGCVINIQSENHLIKVVPHRDQLKCFGEVDEVAEFLLKIPGTYSQKGALTLMLSAGDTLETVEAFPVKILRHNFTGLPREGSKAVVRDCGDKWVHRISLVAKGGDISGFDAMETQGSALVLTRIEGGRREELWIDPDSDSLTSREDCETAMRYLNKYGGKFGLEEITRCLRGGNSFLEMDSQPKPADPSTGPLAIRGHAKHHVVLDDASFKPVYSTPEHAGKFKFSPDEIKPRQILLPENLDQWEARCRETGDPISAEEVLQLIEVAREQDRRLESERHFGILMMETRNELIHELKEAEERFDAQLQAIPEGDVIHVSIPGATLDELEAVLEELVDASPDQRFLVWDTAADFRKLNEKETKFILSGLGIDYHPPVVHATISGNEPPPEPRIVCEGNKIVVDLTMPFVIGEGNTFQVGGPSPLPVRVLGAKDMDENAPSGTKAYLTVDPANHCYLIECDDFQIRVTQEDLAKGKHSVSRSRGDGWGAVVRIETPSFQIWVGFDMHDYKGLRMTEEQMKTLRTIPESDAPKKFETEKPGVVLTVTESLFHSGKESTKATLYRAVDQSAWILVGADFEMVMAEEKLRNMHSGLSVATKPYGDDLIRVCIEENGKRILLDWDGVSDSKSVADRAMLAAFSAPRKMTV